jgi:hypothetical protein
MPVADQVQYESGVRMRYAVIAFCAALCIVLSQLIQLSGVHAPVNELTLALVVASQRGTSDVVAAVFNALGLVSVGVVLYWLHQISAARRPGLKRFVRWSAVVGAALGAFGWLVFWILYTHKAHEFVTSGTQGYPEANTLVSAAPVAISTIAFQLGWLLLAVGCVLVSLSATRVGLVTKFVGYFGVAAGAMFVFQTVVGLFGLIVQVVWLASLAVTLARRWPQGDPPAWEAGVAVPWPSTQNSRPQQDERGTRAQRQRRKVSNTEVLAAVERDAPQVPKGAGRAKRKRRR